MLINRDIEAIYAAHDAGHYQLPVEVLGARDAVRGLVEARGAATAARTAAEHASRHAPSATAAELLALANAGKPLPDDPGRAILDARAAHDLAVADLAALTAAATAGERALRATLTSCADAVIEGSLQPALAGVIEAVRAAAPALSGLDLSNTEALMARADRVEAYGALVGATRRYDAIRAAQLGLHRLTSPGRLPGGAEFRKPAQAAIAHGLTGAARLLALVNAGAELWVPTPAELAKAGRMAFDRSPVPIPSATGHGRSLVGRKAVAQPVAQ